MWASLWENQPSGFSVQVPYKPGCAASEDGKRLEILDLGSRGNVLSVGVTNTKVLIQLCGYRKADLHLCFCICKNQDFSRWGSIYLMVNHPKMRWENVWNGFIWLLMGSEQLKLMRDKQCLTLITVNIQIFGTPENLAVDNIEFEQKGLLTG